MKALRLLLSCLAAGLLLSSSTACGPIACTEELRSSVVVEVRDSMGALVTDATLTFTVDGGPAQPCEAFDSSHNCGWETSGHFVITAKRGAATATAEVDVEDEDRCHVLTARTKITLPAS